ncbi:hypothetical protein DsansV1_C42g0239451 [Dioscorea sansibarensis]
MLACPSYLLSAYFVLDSILGRVSKIARVCFSVLGATIEMASTPLVGALLLRQKLSWQNCESCLQSPE